MEDLSKTHWMALKKMVEARGLEWKDKATAIKALAAAGDGIITPQSPPESPSSSPAPAESAKKPKGNGVMLDRMRPFGTVHGYIEGIPGVCFEQGGGFFDSHGMKVG